MFIHRDVRAVLRSERKTESSRARPAFLATARVARVLGLGAAWVAGVLGLAATGVAGILRRRLLVAGEHAHLQAHGFADPRSDEVHVG